MSRSSTSAFPRARSPTSTWRGSLRRNCRTTAGVGPAPPKLRQRLVVGSPKMVVYDDGSREPIRIHDSGAVLEDPETFGEYRLAYRTGSIISPPIHAREPLALELRDL